MFFYGFNIVQLLLDYCYVVVVVVVFVVVVAERKRRKAGGRREEEEKEGAGGAATKTKTPQHNVGNKSKTTDDVFVPEFSNHPTVAMKLCFSISPIVFHHIINTTLQYSVLQTTTLYIKVPYRVLLSATPCCIVLLRTTKYYSVLPSTTR